MRSVAAILMCLMVIGALCSKEIRASTNNQIPTEFRSRFINRVKLPAKDKVVCLTFDDGPWPKNTQQVLKILRENNAKATFFLVGRNVRLYPSLARQIVNEGHAIGSHSYTHAKKLSKVRAAQEIDWTNKTIEKATGVEPAIFRPPYGIRTSSLSRAARNRDFVIVLWSISSADTAKVTSKIIENNILHTPRPGDIVLMHDGGGNRSHTIKALPHILKGIHKLGYRCVTVPKLLQMWDEEKSKNSKNTKVTVSRIVRNAITDHRLPITDH